MITKIQMKKCAPYDSEGQIIDDCKKINYIYGANGSGKSTISEFLRKYDEEIERYADSSITWSPSGKSTIMVYNREFRKKNFSQDTGIPGVFTLGTATIEDIKELEELKDRLNNKKDEYRKKGESISKKEVEREARKNKFKEDVWNEILKKNEKDFQKAFEGYRNSKAKFLSEVLRRVKTKDGEVKEKEELLNRSRTLYSSKPEKVMKLNCDIDRYITVLKSVCIDPIWQMVITGNESVNIGKLIKQLQNASWVQMGRSYLEEGDNICPFCQKPTIDEAFRKQLELFFDSEYDEKIKEIENNYIKYCFNSDQIINELLKVVEIEVAATIGNLDVTLFNSRVENLKTGFESCKESIQAKKKEPERKITLSDFLEKVHELTEMIKEANDNIEKHNALVEMIDTEINKLTDDVWKTLMEEEALLIETYCKDVNNIEKAITGMTKARVNLRKEIEKLSEEVVEKGKNITSVQPTIDEINRSLKAYGFNNFSIKPATEFPNRYMIMRDDGTSAFQTLSEGEETFLTFLYFMQLTKGAVDAEHISDKKIIVLDDPICSLDSTILYIVANMVKELSKSVRKGNSDVEQLFILTHNVFFHKEASQIDGRTKEIDDVNYWIIRKDDGISKIQSYGMENPITTSYELLWKEMRDNDTISLISLQNTMRRIIENYFGMLGNRKNDYIVDNFSSPEEKTICRSLLAWINDGSHSIPDDLFIDSYTDAVPRYKKVFKEIFENSGNMAHYNMMMGIESQT